MVLPRILELAQDSSIGVVAVDERLIAELSGDRPLRKIERRWPGLVVVLPSPKSAPRQDDDYALALIRQAIGYQVRVNP
jgi:vacuolar-type H+-ATPase subunit F/Vma7